MGTLRVSFFTPGSAVLVVSADLPVARLVPFDESDAGQPFGALPEVEAGHDRAHRWAVWARQRSTVQTVRHQHVGLQRLREGDVCSVAVGSLEHDVSGGG